MPGIDSYDMYLSALGFIPKLRFLLPRNVIPPVSALLNETRQLLDHAEAIGAILPQSECRSHFERSANEFAAMRVQSNLARGIFGQVVILPRLTYKLYSLRGQIEDIRSELELVVDRKLLQDATMENATNTAVLSPTLSPTTATATSADSITEATLPLPATAS